MPYSGKSSAEPVVLYDEISVIDRALKELSGRVSERQIRLARTLNRPGTRQVINDTIADGMSKMPGPVLFGLNLAAKAAKFDFETGVPNIFIQFVVGLPLQSFNHLWSQLATVFTYAGEGKDTLE